MVPGSNPALVAGSPEFHLPKLLFLQIGHSLPLIPFTVRQNESVSRNKLLTPRNGAFIFKAHLKLLYKKNRFFKRKIEFAKFGAL
jgi:hypothetical protein